MYAALGIRLSAVRCWVIGVIVGIYKNDTEVAGEDGKDEEDREDRQRKGDGDGDKER